MEGQLAGSTEGQAAPAACHRARRVRQHQQPSSMQPRQRVSLPHPDAHHLSKRQRKRELSTLAQARLISGNTPQKATVWRQCKKAGVF